MSMNGIDISSHQKGIDISKVPCDFVIIKATQGTSYINPYFRSQIEQAINCGKKVGIYHYFGGNDPETEAKFFLTVIRNYINKAILVLDWESYQNGKFNDGVPIAKKFLDYVYGDTGVKPLIYMSKSVCRNFDWTPVVKADYGLWVAQYKNNEQTGYQYKPWTDTNGYGAFKSPAIFQYTSNGKLSGFSGALDLDIAYMEKDAWDKYAGVKEEEQSYNIVVSVKTVKSGSTGNHVILAQSILYGKGYYSGKIDGIAGNETINGIKQYQKDNENECGECDGICGLKTWKSLLN